MKLLSFILFEYILGYCLQSYILVFGIYMFSRQKIILKQFILLGMVATIIAYLVRLLPISFGVHTIFDMLALIILCITILKIPAIDAIKSISMVLVLVLSSEMIGLTAMYFIFGAERFQEIMSDSSHKISIILPLNLLLLFFVVLSHYFIKKKDVSDKKGGS